MIKAGKPGARWLWLAVMILLLAGGAYLAMTAANGGGFNGQSGDSGTVAEPESVEVLVNKTESLAAEYVPPDLVDCGLPAVKGISDEERMLRSEAAQALSALFQAADGQGIKLYMLSGYRSYEHQADTYRIIKGAKGEQHASMYVAVPGHSEHQTGLAMDMLDIDHGDDDYEKTFGTTEAGIWLRDNAHSFGFILRYPEGKEDVTGYSYEPWHFRYVGIKLAATLHDAGLTLDEYTQGTDPGT